MHHKTWCKMCELHTCPCGKTVNARGLHGFSCRNSASRYQRHSNLNDIIWRAVKRASIPAVKEPVDLSQSNAKRPDEATLIHWAREKALTWDVTVPDTFLQSHVDDTAILAGAAPNDAATKKEVQVSVSDRHQYFLCQLRWKLERMGHTSHRVHRRIRQADNVCNK